MRGIDYRHFRRPYLYAIGIGIQIASVLNLLSQLVSGEFAQLPTLVKATPLVGFLAFVVLYVLSGYSEPRSGEASR